MDVRGKGKPEEEGCEWLRSSCRMCFPRMDANECQWMIDILSVPWINSLEVVGNWNGYFLTFLPAGRG